MIALGIFGHHPDPEIDREVEIEIQEGLRFDLACGLARERSATDGPWTCLTCGWENSELRTKWCRNCRADAPLPHHPPGSVAVVRSSSPASEAQS